MQKLDDRSLRRIHAERQCRPHPRSALINIAIGSSLTLTTMVTGFANLISTQQAIAFALPAVLATLGGFIGIVVPNAWAAWRRGFREGCKIAMDSQKLDVLASVTAHPAEPEPGEPGIVDLFARSGTRPLRKTQPRDAR